MQGEHESSERLLERVTADAYRKVMIIGANDTGKTFLVLAAADRLCEEGKKTALLDFDLGQSSVGPPGCVGLQCPWEGGGVHLFPTGMVFLGITSPAYDVASVVEAGLRLQGRAPESGCEKLLIDTSGMVEGELASLLKRSKIRALRPDLVVVLDRAGEALHIFRGLEEGAYGEISVVKAPPAARRKSREERAAYRRELFREYFRDSRELEVGLEELVINATLPRLAASKDTLREGLLLGLNDPEGFTLALARVMAADGDTAKLLTPFRGTLAEVSHIAVGPALLDHDGNLRIPCT